MDTFYLLLDLNGTLQTLELRDRMAIASPVANSIHLSKAASEASPLIPRCITGRPCCRFLNSARLHRQATRDKAFQPGLDLSYWAPIHFRSNQNREFS
jgi:hypothetical protein